MKYAILLVIITLAGNAFGQELDCKTFHNGKFLLENTEIGNTIIERKGDVHTEYVENLGIKINFKIKWINDCTCRLEVREIVKNPNQIEFPKDIIFTIEIVETKEQSYIQSTTSNFSDYAFKSEILKIE